MSKTTEKLSITDIHLQKLEVPIRGQEDEYSGVWGSDVIAELIQRLDLEFIAMVPGSSFRGLQDSLVNHLGNSDLKMVVCLHEEHAVAIADGYGRVLERPMAVALHSNVGLMHATMPIYNAWCDRTPMLIIGATGPVDAYRRRPWIDWVHTSKDQGALVRAYVKWDDQPASVQASVESLLRANQITTSYPFGPTYVCLDVSVQEDKLETPLNLPPVKRFAAPLPPGASVELADDVLAAISKARKPLFLFGRMSRSTTEWDARVQLAEQTGAAVMTSLHNAAAFPTDHRQHLVAPCAERRSDEEQKIIVDADLIVSFDWMDLAGFLSSCTGQSQTGNPIITPIVHCSMESVMANGWSMDLQALPAVDIPVFARPDTFVSQLLVGGSQSVIETDWDFSQAHWSTYLPTDPHGEQGNCISLGDFAMAVRSTDRHGDVTFVRFPLGWPRTACKFNHPLSYLGKDGGGAVGIGPGHAVGAALALRNSGRIVTAVLGDGDTLMGINALWTASHLQLPLLIIVANNTSYFNDELHQERIARSRNRPIENRWIGQRLLDPEIDLLAMAKAQGFEGEGPVRTREGLECAIERGTAIVKTGGRYLIDARIEAGYIQNFGLKAL